MIIKQNAAVDAGQVEEEVKTLETEAKTTEAVDVTPEPTPEEIASEKAAKAQEKLDRRFAQMTKKIHQAEARAEAAERYYAQGRNQETQTEKPAADIEQLVEQKLAEREGRAKRESVFAKAEKDADFDREDFLDTTTVTPVMADAILESDLGDKIIKHLYLNQDEADRIASLSPARQAAEIGRLEMQLSAPKAAVKKSGAPSPITPLGGKQTPTGLSDDASIEDWMKERKRQLGQK